MKGICHKFGELCIMLPMRNSSLFSLFHLILRFSLCHLMQQNSFKNVLSRCICFFFSFQKVTPDWHLFLVSVTPKIVRGHFVLTAATVFKNLEPRLKNILISLICIRGNLFLLIVKIFCLWSLQLK